VKMSKAFERWEQRMKERSAKETTSDTVEAEIEAKSILTVIAAVAALHGTGRFPLGRKSRYAMAMRQMGGIDLFRKDIWSALAVECDGLDEEAWAHVLLEASALAD